MTPFLGGPRRPCRREKIQKFIGNIEIILKLRDANWMIFNFGTLLKNCFFKSTSKNCFLFQYFFQN